MAKKTQTDKIKEEVKLELTPMIDVTFLILIFFMCTLKFKTLEGKLVSYLPTDKGLSTAQADIEFEDAEIILKVKKEDWNKPTLEREIIFQRNGDNTPFGRCRGIRLDPKDPKKATWDLDPPNTLEAVKEYLDKVRATSPESKAKINAYARTPHMYVVQVLNMMIEAEFNDISYSGIPAYLVRDLQLPISDPKRIK